MAMNMSKLYLLTQDSFDETAVNTVVIPKENAKFKWYVSYNYPNWEIIECDSFNEAAIIRKSANQMKVWDAKLQGL